MAAKLPLLTRKNIRDEYTNKISEHTSKIKEYTGEDYELVVNFEQLYPTLKQDESYQTGSPGTIAFSAYGSLVDKLKRATDEGEDKLVMDFFNEVVSSRKINILVEDLPSGYTAIRVKDGVLELVYKTDNYGTNTSYIAEDLEKALDAAFAETNKGDLPLAARIGFKKDFEDKKEALEAKINEELLDAKVKLVADPADIWKVAIEEHSKLKKREQSEIDLESIARNMGAAIYAYFDGFKGQLEYKFKQDDLMVEGFLELCTSNEIRVKVVPKGGLSPNRSYNDAVFEDGALVIRTTPQNWYTNVSYAADEVDALL
ncbi:hypothetical protein ABW20_dc0102372 [Dactylellina cionopaga]|nr:hypothetical protein ABW20_dc0102372 [Dactylellina cionopaga]